MAKKKVWRSFEEAREWVRGLGLRNEVEWREYRKSGNLPSDIPANPGKVYDGKGWAGMGDWLGTGYIAHKDRQYRPFPQAREYAHGLGMKSWAEWQEHSKSGKLPSDIPADPGNVYEGKGWAGIGDWLGTGNIAPQNRQWRPFPKAREYAQELGLKSRAEWNEHSKSGRLPSDIPADPGNVYDGKGWAGMGDWLGTGYIAHKDRQYRPFPQAREYAHGLGMKSRAEWQEHSKSGKLPSDIPATPWQVYKGQGWVGFPDFLGYTPKHWYSHHIAAFFTDLLPRIPHLPLDALISIIVSGDNAPPALQAVLQKRPQLIHKILTIAMGKGSEDEKAEACLSMLQAEVGDVEIEEVEDDEVEIEEGEEPGDGAIIAPSDPLRHQGLPQIAGIKATLELASVLGCIGAEASDEELYAYLRRYLLNQIWNGVLNSTPEEVQAYLEALQEGKGEPNYDAVADDFAVEYAACLQMPTPAGYDFRDSSGAHVEPTLMQRYTCYRLQSERSFMNLSGTGSGKTLSAILASRGVPVTVVVAPNDTVGQWGESILRAFPDSVVYERPDRRSLESLDLSRQNYLIFHYQAFQGPRIGEFVEWLAEAYPLGMLVIDEMQCAKHRGSKGDEGRHESRRRVALKRLRTLLPEDAMVLGMSATPIINDFSEGIALVELVLGKDLSRYGTTRTLANAMNLRRLFITHGLRYLPRHEHDLVVTTVAIDGTERLQDLHNAFQTGEILAQECLLAEMKLAHVVERCLQAKAAGEQVIVYTHYVDALDDRIVGVLQDALKRARLSCATYTGMHSRGVRSIALEQFRGGKVDVLVASQPIATGVNGLQECCRRMIIVSLPWTHDELIQLVGRLHRWGAKAQVEVVIPQVVVETGEGEPWSWDRQRHAVIEYKRTLADLVVDGVIPTGEIAPREVLARRAWEVLDERIRGMANGVGVETADAQLASEPVAEQDTYLGGYGELGGLNNRWNATHSSKTHLRLKADPNEWHRYHELYSRAREEWSEVPALRISERIGKRPDWIVGDFGCGEALLARALRNPVHSFDHIAASEGVVACDIAQVPLPDESLDAAVLSLALMGSNWEDYIREATRKLRWYGRLFVAEPVNRWDTPEKQGLLRGCLEGSGLRIAAEETRGKWLYIEAERAEG